MALHQAVRSSNAAKGARTGIATRSRSVGPAGRVDNEDTKSTADLGEVQETEAADNGNELHRPHGHGGGRRSSGCSETMGEKGMQGSCIAMTAGTDAGRPGGVGAEEHHRQTITLTGAAETVSKHNNNDPILFAAFKHVASNPELARKLNTARY